MSDYVKNFVREAIKCQDSKIKHPDVLTALRQAPSYDEADAILQLYAYFVDGDNGYGCWRQALDCVNENATYDSPILIELKKGFRNG